MNNPEDPTAASELDPDKAKDIRKITSGFSPEDIVHRITSVILGDLVTELFTSIPAQTGGQPRFPYCRVDASLLVCRDRISLCESEPSETKKQNHYDIAAREAFQIIVWVEIGFQDLDNLAESPLSRNWTSQIGNYVNDDQRAEGIKTLGRELYRSTLQNFANFRDKLEIKDDIFSRYPEVERLLDKFRSS